ncbi:MAG: CoA-binding protein [Dehalococcoidia bacterium]
MPHPLDPVFHPRSIAVVGVSSRESARAPGFLGALLDLGYHQRHQLYVVNPRATEVRGIPSYPTVLDCPDPIDHVISLIPREGAQELLRQAIQKGVRSIHFFTAGFSESGDEEMAAVEREMAAEARAAGVRMLGPNCMGMYVPSQQVSWTLNVPKEPGSVFALSQSGVNAGAIITELADRGVRFSKVVSFGNGADIAAPELLEYAAEDPETKVVVGYLESVRDGRRLFEALKRCAAMKPTVILKGGVTGAGARAAMSHTASLAGSLEVFDAMCRQVGALRVETLEQLQDVTVALTTSLHRAAGRRAVLFGVGGGFSVLSADAIAREGLELPELATAVQKELAVHLPIAGNSVVNPIDATFPAGPRTLVPEKVLPIVGTAKNYDILIASVEAPRPPNMPPEPPAPNPPPPPPPDERPRDIIELLAEVQKQSRRPIAAVSRSRDPQRFNYFAAQAHAQGVAAFPSVARAAATLGQLAAWREARQGLPDRFR